MKRTKQILIIVVLVIIALSIAYFTFNYTKEGNALIATYFVKNEATYKFDGMPETFKLNADETKMPCPYCWEFTFEYQSRNSGYGDRKDSMDGVITSHYAVLFMEKGTIQSAALDDKWDMKAQQFIKSVSSTSPRRPR